MADIDDQSTASDNDDNDDNEKTEPPKACSLSELDFHIQQIKNFALVNGRQRLLNAAIEMEDDTADLCISKADKNRGLFVTLFYFFNRTFYNVIFMNYSADINTHTFLSIDVNSKIVKTI